MDDFHSPYECHYHSAILWGGDRIFFGFLGHLCRSLLFPGTAGLIFLIVTQFVEVEGHRLDGLRTSLCVPMSIWAASSLHVFERKTARMKQLWGVHEREAREMPNPDWNPTPHSGAALLKTLAKLCGQICNVALCS